MTFRLLILYIRNVLSRKSSMPQEMLMNAKSIGISNAIRVQMCHYLLLGIQFIKVPTSSAVCGIYLYQFCNWQLLSIDHNLCYVDSLQIHLASNPPSTESLFIAENISPSVSKDFEKHQDEANTFPLQINNVKRYVTLSIVILCTGVITSLPSTYFNVWNLSSRVLDIPRNEKSSGSISIDI